MNHDFREIAYWVGDWVPTQYLLLEVVALNNYNLLGMLSYYAFVLTVSCFNAY